MVAMPTIRWTKLRATRSPMRMGLAVPRTFQMVVPAGTAAPSSTKKFDTQPGVEGAEDPLEDVSSADDRSSGNDGRREGLRFRRDARVGREIPGSDVLREGSRDETRWAWVEPTAWTTRMLTALETGVKGGRWFSLMDKVYGA